MHLFYKKIQPVILGVLVCFLSVQLKAMPAGEYPDLTFKDLHVNIPVYIFGIQKDSLVTSNDTLRYLLKGKRYGDNEGQIPALDKPSKSKSTPLEVLATAMYYYRQKNVEEVKNLFDRGNHNALNDAMPGKKLDSFVDQMSKINEVKVEMAFDYNQGVVCIVNFKGMNILPMYFIKVKGSYYLSALRDDKPTLYNLMVYLMINPKPFEPVTVVSLPDTLRQDTLSNMIFRLKTGGNYLVIGENKPGSSVFLLCKDNTAPDMDQTQGIIKFTAQSHNFVDPGKMDFIAFESNFPVNQIYPLMLSRGKKFSVYIKK